MWWSNGRTSTMTYTQALAEGQKENQKGPPEGWEKKTGKKIHKTKETVKRQIWKQKKKKGKITEENHNYCWLSFHSLHTNNTHTSYLRLFKVCPCHLSIRLPLYHWDWLKRRHELTWQSLLRANENGKEEEGNKIHISLPQNSWLAQKGSHPPKIKK